MSDTNWRFSSFEEETWRSMWRNLLAPEANVGIITLMEGLWFGLDDYRQLVMPQGKSYCTLAEYINFALWVKGLFY